MSNILSKLINFAGNLTGLCPVANGGTGLASGTSGGVLGYTASGTLVSSAALTANGVVIGGGAGATPTSTAADATTTHILHGGSPPSFGAMIGADMPIVVPGTSAGAVSASGLTGATAGSLIGAGFVGEVISATATNQTISGTISNIVSISITAGVWAIFGSCTSNGSGTTTGIQFGISTSSTTFDTATSDSKIFAGANVSQGLVGGTVGPRTVSITGAAVPYYLVAAAYAASITTAAQANIKAIRIA